MLNKLLENSFFVKGCFNSENSRIVPRSNTTIVRGLTAGRHVRHVHSLLHGHKAEHGEDDEASVEARRTVDDGHQDGVS